MLLMSVQSGRAYRTEVSYPIIWTYMLLQSQGVNLQALWKYIFAQQLMEAFVFYEP